MSEEVKRSVKHEKARNSLPEELKPVFDELVGYYMCAATIHHRSPFVSHIILAEMVRAGWRQTGEPIGLWKKSAE